MRNKNILTSFSHFSSEAAAFEAGRAEASEHAKASEAHNFHNFHAQKAWSNDRCEEAEEEGLAAEEASKDQASWSANARLAGQHALLGDAKALAFLDGWRHPEQAGFDPLIEALKKRTLSKDSIFVRQGCPPWLDGNYAVKVLEPRTAH